MTRETPPHSVLDLCETRLELIECLLRDGQVVEAESEALQVTAGCKKVFKTARGGEEGETAVMIRCLGVHVHALEVLRGIDEGRGIVARAARWREARERLEGKLAALEA
jgi:hypothetical protein